MWQKTVILRIPILVFLLSILYLVPSRLQAQTGGCLGVSDATTARSVADDPDICLDCIVFAPKAQLGTEDGPGFIEVPDSEMAIDELGRYWVMHPEGAKVFSPTGQFLRLVGRRGEGPGEFRTPADVVSDPQGLVHIFDADNMRFTTYDLDFEIVNTAITPGLVHQAEVIPGRGNFLTNMLLYRTGSIGRSLHTIDMDTGQRGSSFAMAPEAGRMVTLFALSVTDDGVVIAGNIDAYSISLWSPAGESMDCLVRPGLFEPRDVAALRVRNRNPGDPPELTGILAAVHGDDQGLLWVSAWIPKEGYRENLIRVDRPGRPPVFRRGRAETIYSNVIEVIDLDRGTIVARTELEEGPFVVGFLDHSTSYGTVYTDQGAPQIVVSEITLETDTLNRRETP